jgi:hypothetical protein
MQMKEYAYFLYRVVSFIFFGQPFIKLLYVLFLRNTWCIKPKTCMMLLDLQILALI